MRHQTRTVLIAALALICSQLAIAPVGAVVAPQKVVIIVGPTGALTANYRSKGDAIATAAAADGATVVKVYSPNATWAAVKAAVNGANIIVYLGHGNGFPNPYNSTEATDRDNGWGLNRTTAGGDSDDWSATMVYCGEKALLGTLTSSDGAAQRTYCAGGPITPAANWVMIYSNACYAPGASEGWDVPATEAVALQRVRNFSYPGLKLGGGAYFATDENQGSQQLVDTILRNPDMPFGAIAENANGYDLSRQRHFPHPDLAGTRIWIQNTGDATSGDYFLAYAGKPALTPSGTTVAYTKPVPPPVDMPPAVLSRARRPLRPRTSPFRARGTPRQRGVCPGGGTHWVPKKPETPVGRAPPWVLTRDPHRDAVNPWVHPLPTRPTAWPCPGWIKDLAGIALPWTTWTFTTLSTTDVIAPAVVARQPAASATNVGLSPNVTARFSEAVTGVTGASMVLSKTADLVGLSATVSYDPTTPDSHPPPIRTTCSEHHLSGWHVGPDQGPDRERAAMDRVDLLHPGSGPGPGRGRSPAGGFGHQRGPVGDRHGPLQRSGQRGRREQHGAQQDGRPGRPERHCELRPVDLTATLHPIGATGCEYHLSGGHVGLDQGPRRQRIAVDRLDLHDRAVLGPIPAPSFGLCQWAIGTMVR